MTAKDSPDWAIEKWRRLPRVAWTKSCARRGGILRINGTRFVRPSTIGLRIVSFDFHRKAEVLPGLELADLVVSPLGRLVAGMPDRPDTEIVVGKLRTGLSGSWEGAGLVVLPKEKGRGPLRSTRPRPV